MLRKTVCSRDISEVDLIVGWNELAKSTKIKISSVGMFHLLQMNGLSGLANTSHFSRSAKKKNRKSDCHFSSHSGAVSLYKVFFIQIERIFFKHKPH